MNNKKKGGSDEQKGELTNRFSLIEKIIKMLVKYGYKKVASALVIFILFIATLIIFANQKIIIQKIIEEQKQEVKQDEINKINFRIKHVNPRVDAILYKLLTKTKADRAFIIEMHNGTDNTSGLPFVYGDMTYERVSNDAIESVIFQYENINLSTLPLSIYLMKNKKFIGTIDDLKLIDNRLAKKMDANQAKFIAIYGLRTINVEIGWVGITYSQEDIANKSISNIEANLLDASQCLSILLDITDNIKEN